MKILFILFFFSTPFYSSAQSLLPGIWEAKSNFTVNGVPLPAGNEEECISAADAKDAKLTIAKELKKNGCEITQWKVTGKKLVASLKCQNDELDATGTLKGTFSEKSYDLSGEAEGLYQNLIPSQASLKLEGRWLKKCPQP